MEKQYTRAPSVRIAFRSFGRTLRHGYDNLATLSLASLLWIVCTLPAIPLLAIIAPFVDDGTLFWMSAAILMVGIGPPTAALHRVTQPMTEERASSWTIFWESLRPDFGWSLRLSWTMLLVLLVVDLNRRFYAQNTNIVVTFIGVFFLVFTIVWVGMLFFAMPIALRQTQRSLRMTLRNAAVMVLGNLPGVIVSLLLLLLSSIVFLVPPLFLLLPGWIALWSEENVRLLLVASGYIPPDEFADRYG